MLELAGVPYTGASPLGHAVSLDKTIAKRLLQAAGVPTPAFTLMEDPQDLPPALRYPVIVKPRRESTSYGLTLAHDQAQLHDAVANVVSRYGQAALVELCIDGREVCVALLGNDPLECCHARDYARVDIRIDMDGRPWVLELNSMGSLGARGSYVRAAEAAGTASRAL